MPLTETLNAKRETLIPKPTDGAGQVAISQDPLPIIGVSALVLIFVVSYLIRLAEGPAGQAHSTYIWDQACRPRQSPSQVRVTES